MSVTFSIEASTSARMMLREMTKLMPKLLVPAPWNRSALSAITGWMTSDVMSAVLSASTTTAPSA